MVDVSGKAATVRRAVAEAVFVAGARVMQAVGSGAGPKGNVYETARIAGIQAAKRTWELIPLCHQLLLDHVRVDFEVMEDRVRIVAEAATRASTGVEMEALTAAAAAALTLYDMTKALERGMRIEGIRLLEKTGGRSGGWTAGKEDDRG